MSNRIGYLSHTGKFFDCMAYGHLELARKLCLRLYQKEFDNRVQAESFLLQEGWVMFQEYTVEYKFKQNDEWRFLTPQQKYFLMDEVDTCTDELKLSGIEAILEMNQVLNNTKL